MNDLIKLKIENVTYGMRKMPPMRASAFGLKVMKVAGSALSNPAALSIFKDISAKAKNGKAEVEEMDKDNVMTTGMALLKLLDGIDTDKVSEILRESFSYEVYAEDKRLSDEVNFDIHFQQHPGHLYVVGIWATWNHVKDFFSGLGVGMTALMKSSGTSQPDRQ